MNNKIITGLIIIVLVIAGAIFLIRGSEDTESTQEKTNTVMEKKDVLPGEAIKKDDSAMKDEAMMEKISPPAPPASPNTNTPPPTAMMDKHGSYQDYSAATVKSEQAGGNKVVLFFHAAWCPFCKTADGAFINRASEIPAGVTILKTDYDSNTDLKKKYGVTYQHTFVQIDSDGNAVTKWNGGDIDNLKKYLK